MEELTDKLRQRVAGYNLAQLTYRLSLPEEEKGSVRLPVLISGEVQKIEANRYAGDLRTAGFELGGNELDADNYANAGNVDGMYAVAIAGEENLRKAAALGIATELVQMIFPDVREPVVGFAQRQTR